VTGGAFRLQVRDSRRACRRRSKVSPGKSRSHHDAAPYSGVHRFGRDRRFTRL